MECGSKMVEGGPTELPMSSGSRPRDTGHLWNSQIGFQEDRSLLRSPHRDFAAMLRAETIKTCLPDRDPYDLQRAVNVYHSFRHETYKFITRKHRSSQHVQNVTVQTVNHHTYGIRTIHTR